MEYGVVAAHAAHGLATHDLYADGVDAVGLNVFYVGKMDAVFVTERKIGEQVFEGMDAAAGEEFGALRTDALDHANFGGKSLSGHSGKDVPRATADRVRTVFRCANTAEYFPLYTIMTKWNAVKHCGSETCAGFVRILE